MRRLRLYWRLLRLVPRLWADPDVSGEVRSESEAIYRALGHEYNPDMILPKHANLT